MCITFVHLRPTEKQDDMQLPFTELHVCVSLFFALKIIRYINNEFLFQMISRDIESHQQKKQGKKSSKGEFDN